MDYEIFPLGDQAITVSFGNSINFSNHRKVVALKRFLDDNPVAGFVDIVIAYSSLTILYDAYQLKQHSRHGSVYAQLKSKLDQAIGQLEVHDTMQGRKFTIPVCYDEKVAPDLTSLCLMKGVTREEFIKIHASREYFVFMIGFLPGFAYMGEVDSKISAPRKQSPMKVAAGSVGIAGTQTGIYPVASPGGWQIIGRTQVKMFDKKMFPPSLLEAGDVVQFVEVSYTEFLETNNEPV